MMVYLASSFDLIPRVQEVCDRLESQGHTISEKWWLRVYKVKGKSIRTTELKTINDKLSVDEFYNNTETIKSYNKDINGINNASVFVFIASDKPRKYNGASVEYGIALAKGIPCYLLGNLEKSVLFTPMIRCKTVFHLMNKLSDYEKIIAIKGVR
jgi:hypothetical protein